MFVGAVKDMRWKQKIKKSIEPMQTLRKSRTAGRKTRRRRRRDKAAMNRPLSPVVNVHLNHPFWKQVILPNSLITVRASTQCMMAKSR